MPRAEPLFLHALEIRERVLGPDRSSVATAQENLADLYRKMGRATEADVPEQKAAKNRAVRH